ncbi:hypothetical protein BKA93DRAFT_602138 [Sparassis latifolia]
MREAYHNNRDLLAELVSEEDIRLAIMSPQMLRSKRVRSLLSQQAVKSLVCWFFVDEAHLVDEQSGEWIEIFKSIKTMRAILSARTVWAAFTGTATPSRTLVLAENLGFQPGHYVNARYSVDCSNIKDLVKFPSCPESLTPIPLSSVTSSASRTHYHPEYLHQEINLYIRLMRIIRR